MKIYQYNIKIFHSTATTVGILPNLVVWRSYLALRSNFNKWHQRVVDILVRAIEDNVKSVIYSSQNAKMYAILTAYDAALGATIDDVEKTLQTTDGE